ncbi:hypothetical protein [Methylomonas albis]|uniref:ABC transmembrane type-1 domain-containing protein n=1 Tax=Methylomonas albis TaxID=1854563 RepID=A0ABR9CWX2_9GAMM|nr:hypothetical protein [Methylomonas albis]MBD9355383.1 hypothetical protein [Methylomonas albis]CAD6878351.1 hypothetical protein [Methylomonas albis]
MVSQKEFKELAIGLGRKWLFPDFTNKLTWLVVTVGCGILLTSTPLKLIFYNWLVDTINLNSGTDFTIAELTNDSADYIWGVVLVALALIHNIAYRYVNFLASCEGKDNLEKRIKADTALFENFKIEFPSNCASARLLKEHDFSNLYDGEATSNLEKFVHRWNDAEHVFLDPVIESKRIELWESCHSFLYKLAVATGPVGKGFSFSAIPDMYLGERDMPDFVTQRVNELNKKATECYCQHQEFVAVCKERLRC